MAVRPDYRPTAYDDWKDAPSHRPAAQWRSGLVLPLLLIGYGVSCLVTGHGTLSNGRFPRTVMHLHGPGAVSLGVACASGGLFLHFHYFWGSIYEELWWAVLGKIVSMVALIGSLGYLIFHTFLH